jgi:hypothetical protein
MINLVSARNSQGTVCKEWSFAAAEQDRAGRHPAPGQSVFAAKVHFS